MVGLHEPADPRDRWSDMVAWYDAARPGHAFAFGLQWGEELVFRGDAQLSAEARVERRLKLTTLQALASFDFDALQMAESFVEDAYRLLGEGPHVRPALSTPLKTDLRFIQARCLEAGAQFGSARAVYEELSVPGTPRGFFVTERTIEARIIACGLKQHQDVAWALEAGRESDSRDADGLWILRRWQALAAMEHGELDVADRLLAEGIELSATPRQLITHGFAVSRLYLKRGDDVMAQEVFSQAYDNAISHGRKRSARVALLVWVN